ncbi:flavin reductase, partial [Patescibacteria group bacterium]|nr:flavin reductase [Patescibacteria group bacterium]
FKEKGLTCIPGKNVKSPIIEECVLHYECRVLHKNDIMPARVPQNVTSEYYPQRDYHRIFFGEILSVLADSKVKI